MNTHKIALIFEPGHLLVQHWRLTLAGWKVVQTERLPLNTREPLSDQLVGTLRPLAFKWHLPAATPVLVLCPPQTGGFDRFVFERGTKELPSLTEKELARQLPFALREVEWVSFSQVTRDRSEVNVFWLPKAWISELRNALGRAGLRLSELFHRAQLYAARHHERKAPALPHAWLEHYGDELYLYFLRHGQTPERSRQQGVCHDSRLPAALQLDLLTLGLSDRTKLTVDLCEVPSQVQEAFRHFTESQPMTVLQTSKALDPSSALLTFWQRGGSGVWLAPEQATLGLRTAPVALLLGAAGLLFSVSLWWLSSLAEEEIATQEPRLKKLKPAYHKALETEGQIVELQNRLNAIERAAAGHVSPLHHLYQVYKAIPEAVWLTRFRSSKEGVEVEGYGDPAGMKQRLLDSGRFEQIKDIPPLLATDAARQPFAFITQPKVPVPAKPPPQAPAVQPPAAPRAASVTGGK